jgi:predicted dehydrogenase
MVMDTVLVGCGRYAQSVHIPFFKENSDAEIVGTVDPDPYAEVESLNCPHELDPGELREFLDEIGPDALVISTPPTQRKKIYDVVFGRDLYVHIDKPFLAPTEGDLSVFKQTHSDYSERAEAHPRPVSIHSQRRHDDYISACKQALDDVRGRTGLNPHYLTYEGLDGNFRTNAEWSVDTYHGLQNPLGIVLHSYYHYIDTIAYLLESVNVTKIRSTIQPTYLDDINEQNRVTEKQLLGRETSGTAPGPLALAAEFNLHTQRDNQVTVRVHVSHQGVTRRDGAIENQYTENRYSQKQLNFHVGSVLSAHQSSMPKSLDQPKTKRDRLRIDNALTHETTKEERIRQGQGVDAKRRKALESFVNSFYTNQRTRSDITKHYLSHRLFLETASKLL